MSRGCELPTNLQNFTQKDLTEMKIFQKVLGGTTIFDNPVGYQIWSVCNLSTIFMARQCADAPY